MRPLVWFRADLRTDDNRALYHACQEASRGVVGVFTVCHEQWTEHHWADVRVEFLMRNLACLSERLKALKIPLLIVRTKRFDEVPTELLKLARKHDCNALYFNHEYEVNEQRRDEAVREAFRKDGLPVATYHDQTIVRPDAVETQEGKFYTVFTPFKRAWMAHVKQQGGIEPLPAPQRQKELVCSPDTLPERIPGFHLTEGKPDLWPAGEKYALEHLTTYVREQLDDYKKRRDYPAVPATSRLSPYLALGVISPRRCLVEAAEANGGRMDSGRQGPETWISELVWREFYKHILVGYPRVCMGQAFRPETEQLEWSYDEEAFGAWCEGQTGYPIVDAGMRQLQGEGWMHNRVRMVVAMFLTKDLFIDWRWGEKHFMRHLIDGDLASNNGGWQWSASTGTDAAPYFRIFNPFSQSAKFDKDGDYIRHWVPELKDVPTAALHDPAKLDVSLRREAGYPEPICDHKQAREHAISAFKAL
jgi:deoxyribodipyrimidine photo-lyase